MKKTTILLSLLPPPLLHKVSKPPTEINYRRRETKPFSDCPINSSVVIGITATQIKEDSAMFIAPFFLNPCTELWLATSQSCGMVLNTGGFFPGRNSPLSIEWH